jgi:predicted DCC family thiol-disulfide oxidoreductase YuxK
VTPSDVDVEKFLSDKTLVVFDGVCNLCNSSVDFFLSHDKEDRLLFGSFQHSHVEAILRLYGIAEPPTTIYVLQHGKIYGESDAVLRICRTLPFPWRVTYLAVVVPASIRNFVYRIVARNRYTWFGKRTTCRIPSPLDAKKFI